MGENISSLDAEERTFYIEWCTLMSEYCRKYYENITDDNFVRNVS